jgi:hypothetical protein
MNATFVKPTPAKMQLIRTLLAEIQDLNEGVAETWRSELNLARERGQFDDEAAGQAVNDLIGVKRGLTRRISSALPEVPEGHYAVVIDGTTKFYTIKVSSKGFISGYVWASDEQHRLEFPVLRAILNKIVEMGLKESTILFGQKIGTCGRCGRTLTDATSRAAGIGPVCATKI